MWGMIRMLWCIDPASWLEMMICDFSLIMYVNWSCHGIACTNYNRVIHWTIGEIQNIGIQMIQFK